jgi:XapX domain-containing protein
MKALLISFAVGTLVGVLYGVIRVKSPAPPIIALVGLLGIVLGEQGGAWLLAKRFKLQTWLQLTLPAYAKIRSNIRASIPR